MSLCMKCGRALTADEQGLYRKLVNRGATEGLCLNCLSEKIDVAPELLNEKIEQFRRMGCLLFPQKKS